MNTMNSGMGVMLKGTPQGLHNKVSAIKGLRQLTGIGLKEAKQLVESVDATRKPILIPVDKATADANFNEGLDRLREGGISATIMGNNNPVRNAMAKQIQEMVTWATISSQYDIASSLIKMLEDHLPGLPNEYNLDSDKDCQNCDTKEGLAYDRGRGVCYCAQCGTVQTTEEEDINDESNGRE